MVSTPPPQDGAARESSTLSEQEASSVAMADAVADALAAVTQERDRYLDLLQRVRAEFENYQKRIRREMETERRFAVLPLARDLLPVFDNVQRALQAGQTNAGTSALLEGLSLVAKQFDEILQRHEIRSIPAAGQPLDPNLHEAIAQQPSDQYPPHTVIAEVERGYQMHDRVVRPAKVIVAQAPAANEAVSA